MSTFLKEICLIDENIGNKILYVEQPFKIYLSEEEFKAWTWLKNNSRFKIIADESFSS